MSQLEFFQWDTGKQLGGAGAVCPDSYCSRYIYALQAVDEDTVTWDIIGCQQLSDSRNFHLN